MQSRPARRDRELGELLRITEDTACLPLHIARMEEMDPRYVEHMRKYGRRVYPHDPGQAASSH